MVKDLVDLEETAIRREEVRMSLVLHGAVVGRGGSRMRKGGDNAAELAALEFETHPSLSLSPLDQPGLSPSLL